MMKPVLRPEEKPYAEALRKCLKSSAGKAISFPSPSGAVMFFSKKNDADTLENRLTQIENEFLEEDADAKKDNPKSAFQFKNRQDFVNYEVYHGAGVHETLFGEKLKYAGPFAVHLRFTNPRIGWHVWSAIHPKRPRRLIEWTLPMADAFEREAAPKDLESLEELKEIHRALAEVKQATRNHLEQRLDAIGIGMPSSQVSELEAKEKEYERKRRKFISKTTALNAGTAAALGWGASSLGLFAALPYQWSLGGITLNRAKAFADRESAWLKRGIEPKHFVEHELLKELSPNGSLAQRKTSSRRAIVQNILKVLDDHVTLHHRYIDHLDGLIRKLKQTG